MDQGDASELSGDKTRDRMAIELASKAWLANAVRGMLGADFEAQNKVLSHHRAQVVEVDMGAAPVPQGKVLVAGGRGRHGRLGLGQGVAEEVADVVLVDLGLEAQLPLVVEVLKSVL